MTQSIDLTGILAYQQQPNVLVINSPNNEKLLEITNDGDVFFRLNGEWKKIECENDITYVCRCYIWINWIFLQR